MDGAGKEGKDSRQELRVLLVDDNAELRRRTAALLERRGCRVAVAEDGFDALCRLGGLRPAVLIMAAGLPRLDGFQACSLIKHSRHFRHTIVALVSDSDSLLEEARAELAGADHYLATPFRAEDLQRVLDVPADRAGAATQRERA